MVVVSGFSVMSELVCEIAYPCGEATSITILHLGPKLTNFAIGFYFTS